MNTQQPSFIAESSDEYHAKAGEYLSSHLLSDFRRSPKLYRRKVSGMIPDRDSTAYLIGRAAHAIILEGFDAYERTYAFGGPINEKTGEPYGQATKAWASWLAEQGKAEALTFDQDTLCRNMLDAVREHNDAAKMLADGTAEGVLRAPVNGRACQARLDFFNPTWGIIDLKTCDDLNYFEPDAKRYGYIYQMAFYRTVYNRATGFTPCVYIVAVEKKEPYRCGVFEVGQDVLGLAEAENLKAIDRLVECERSGVWPTGFEGRRVLASLE